MTEDALRKLAAEAPLTEGGCFNTFDAHRSAIYAFATKVYGLGRKGSYEIGREDF